jgi:thiamine kinase-like enzyme
MTLGAGLHPHDVAVILSELEGVQYRYVAALRGGESGAHQFLGPSGSPVVIKWDSTPKGREQRARGVLTSERLRTESHWPVPRIETLTINDTLFVLQEFMSGEPPERIDHGLVDELFELHSRRLTLCEKELSTDWAEHLIETLTVGGTGYCLHSSFRDHNDRTRTLIDRIEVFGETLRSRDFLQGDLIHWDLHPGNLLVDSGSLRAVVDTDFAQIGDAKCDLALLALTSWNLECSSSVRSRLFAELGPLDDLKTQAYLAHCFVRLIDWPLRRESWKEVEFWLDQANELLSV